MNEKKYDLVDGKITPFIKLDDSVVRFVSRPKADPEDEDFSCFVAQGHITSASEYQLDDLSIDVSFLDSSGTFLGLSKSGVFDADELAPTETHPFEIDLKIPDETTQCILNISAKERTGLWANLWLGKARG